MEDTTELRDLLELLDEVEGGHPLVEEVDLREDRQGVKYGRFYDTFSSQQH